MVQHNCYRIRYYNYNFKNIWFTGVKIYPIPINHKQYMAKIKNL